MNTRQSIQPSDQPAVLSISLSASRQRFVTGLADGLRLFRTDNCLATYRPSLTPDGGVAVVEALDDRFLAFVGGGKIPAGSANVAIFWDAVLDKEITRFDFHEPVLGIRIDCKYMVTVLSERTVVFEYQEIKPQAPPKPPPQERDVNTEPIRGPNKVKALYATAVNPYALACLRNNLLVLPAQATGQVQLIPLAGGSKRVLRAHNSSLRCIALSEDGSLLATASERGTLTRVFHVGTLDTVIEVRRGLDSAITFGIAFSPGNRWLASTSDKGTLHVFDLRPPDPAEAAAARDKAARERRRDKSQSYAAHRLSGTAFDKESLSGLSGRSSPASGTGYQGSVQEYYGLRPPPSSAAPPGQHAAASAMAALKAISLAPRILKDVRSIAGAPFYLGNDPPHWQGGAAYNWTTTPNGTRKRVRHPVEPLPNDPTGKPPKGLLAFAPSKGGERSDDEGAVLYVIGGGSDARWEMFELLPAAGGEWALVNRGFRRYLTRQFVD